jgi:hypothetical protein
MFGITLFRWGRHNDNYRTKTFGSEVALNMKRLFFAKCGECLKSHHLIINSLAMVFLGIMALVVSLIQTSTFNRQTKLISYQTQLAKIQTEISQHQLQREKDQDRIEGDSAWASLYTTLMALTWENVELGRPRGLPSSWPSKERRQYVEWISSQYKSQLQNPILLRNVDALKLWTSAIGECMFALRIENDIETTPPECAAESFNSLVQSAEWRASSVWVKVTVSEPPLNPFGAYNYDENLQHLFPTNDPARRPR